MSFSAHLRTVCVGLVPVVRAYACGRGLRSALAMMQQLFSRKLCSWSTMFDLY